MEIPLSWIMAAAGGAFLFGAFLLLWGRVFGRVFLALVGAAVGLGLGQLAAERYTVNAILAPAIGAVAGGAVAFLTARLLWALVAAAILGTAACAAVAAVYQPQLLAKLPGYVKAEEGSLFVNLAAMGNVGEQGIRELWDSQRVALASAGGAGTLVPLLLVLLLPRAGRIGASSLLGAVGIAGGIVALCLCFSPSIAEGLQSRWFVPTGAAGGLWIIGLFVQGHSDVVLRRQAQAAEKEKQKEQKARNAAREGAED